MFTLSSECCQEHRSLKLLLLSIRDRLSRMSSPSVSRSARARAREEITREIKAAARRQLADLGAGGLSLRAVARELGLASSAVYRYFATRDELLTALIVDAYEAVGDVAEEA